MPTPVKSKKGEVQTTNYLESYALFILHNHLDEFVDELLNLSYALNLPLLKLLKDMPREQLKGLAKQSNIELLTSLAQGKAAAHTHQAIQRWLSDQLPLIEREQVVVEDISLAGRVRKHALTHFIPKFTKQIPVVIQLVNEIDDYLLHYTSEMFKAFRDILESRIRENVHLTEQANANFKQAQAITHIGNYIWDLKTNKLTWSDELYRIYGLDPAATDLSDTEAIRPFNHPEDQDVISKHINHSTQTLEPFDFYYRIILADQSIKVLRARGEVEADQFGKASRILGTAQEVTSEKQLEKKLMEHQIFIQKIADATPSIIASYNIHTGKYVFINEGIKKLLGYEPQTVLDQGVAFFASLIHPDDVHDLMQKNNEAVQQANKQTPEQNESIQEFQYRMRHVNGEYRWFHTFGTVFDRNSKNDVEHVLNISLDITERVKAEQILLQRTSELQQSNASLEEFAFVASHDLKEPLRKIITFSDRLIASQRDQLTEDGKNYLEKIMNSSIRMQQMISDLLELSVISTDKILSTINLRKLVEEVLMTFEFKIEETQARIEVDDLPDAHVVPSQFRRLFQNIISNSLKFSRKSIPTVITIKHHFLSAHDVQSRYVNIQRADKYLSLEITDNGIGFDNAYVDKIFAVFQRLHQRESYEGTGIGLSICKKIIENHGGVIHAKGILGQGATFTVIIPQ